MAPGLTIPSAAKTGTAQDNQSVWYAGYTPKLAAMAMIAGVKKNGSPKSLAGVTINGRFLDFHTVGGSSLAGPMWAKAMHAIQDFLPSENFDKPPKGKPAPPKKEKKKRASTNDTRRDGNGRGGRGGNDTGGGGGR